MPLNNFEINVTSNRFAFVQRTPQNVLWCWQSHIAGCVVIRLKSPAWPGAHTTRAGWSPSPMTAQPRSVLGLHQDNAVIRCTKPGLNQLSTCCSCLLLSKSKSSFHSNVFSWCRCGTCCRRQLSLTIGVMLVTCCPWTGHLWIPMWSGLEGRTSRCRSGESPNKSLQNHLKVNIGV